MRVSEEHVTHPDAAFRFLRLALRGFGGARHRHAQVELTWVERGQGLRFVGDHVEPFADGDLVLLGPWVPHLWSGQAAAGDPDFIVRVVQFPLALLAQPAWPELARLQPLLARATRGLVIVGGARARVTQALSAMDAAGPVSRLSLLLQLLAALDEASGAEGNEVSRTLSSTLPTARADPAARRIDRVLDWMHGQAHGPLTLADAARQAHVSPAAFSRFFRRETGKTWTEAVNDVRCSEAALRLRQTARPVSEVAHDCGYATLSHFNRAFLARFGVTPGQYRRGIGPPR